ncbi:uncharacterized protein [Engystomops pustulosus]|uniref:uncharacterized protein n=1 Tax=Engystomops pustulosus TaxID=76066 RepID=UPI003AFAE792
MKMKRRLPQTSIEFLDLKVSVVGNSLQTDLHRKSTATNSLLHFSSFHPHHLKNGIPTGQFIRVRRNCSTLGDFRRNAGDLTQRFRDRGYPKKSISRAFQRARDSQRENLLQPKQRTKEPRYGIITTFNNQWNDIRCILNRNWNILLAEPKLGHLISEQPCLIAKRAKNLKDRLVSSHYQKPKRSLMRGIKLTGSHACGECSICPLMRTKKEIVDSTNQKTFKLREFINCKSRNVVYALICPCQKLYVGQTTQELRKRVQQHLSSITNAESHFNQGKVLSTVATHFRRAHAGFYKQR